MKHGAKTVHVDARSSFAGSLITIFAGKSARAAESKTLRETLPGKSRVGRILLNDNNSQERLLDMKLADIHQMRRKAETFVSHQQKTFIARLEKRQKTWVKEHDRFSNTMNLSQPKINLEESLGSRESLRSRDENKVADPKAEVAKPEAQSRDMRKDRDDRHSLPSITYLTEATDTANNNTHRESDNSETKVFEKPKLFVGLPPLMNAKRSGFQPSGNIDEMFDDRHMKQRSYPRPPARDAIDGTILPTLDPTGTTDPNGLPGEKSPRPATAIPDDDVASRTSTLETGTFPSNYLSHSLPKIEIREPPRKSRARRAHQPRMRRSKRVRHFLDEADDLEDPLEDDRFLKLHNLLANQSVADHETREFSAVAGGVIAAKKFSQRFKKN